MSVHHIVGNEAFRFAGRRLSPVAAGSLTPTRRRRGIDWRVVGMVAICAILLVAMMARP